ncbi:hypothetical protein E6C27_scaffold56G00990 [Cucumis melo var. makuwa]|uniref:Uncharacterized protein n=1 Tax=Cucumis melo var. makuwa TaxID=1194695 RepID=A0A5A7SX58_CUCMM|nr:hypothetical protein E6C27_scaffold56G00990 [Cucumis melo var. makuwa]
MTPRTPSIRPSLETRTSFTRKPTRSRLRPAARTTRVHKRTTPAPKPSRARVVAEPLLSVPRRACLRRVRADPSLQAKPVPISLAEPTRLSLSRQPAPVPLHLFWNTLDQLTWSVGFLQQGLQRCNLDLGYDSSDSTGSLHPDCLSASPGFTTDQYVLDAPPGYRRPDFRSYGSACCTCSGMCQRLGRGRGRGKGKLASDQK